MEKNKSIRNHCINDHNNRCQSMSILLLVDITNFKIKFHVDRCQNFIPFETIRLRDRTLFFQSDERNSAGARISVVSEPRHTQALTFFQLGYTRAISCSSRGLRGGLARFPASSFIRFFFLSRYFFTCTPARRATNEPMLGGVRCRQKRWGIFLYTTGLYTNFSFLLDRQISMKTLENRIFSVFHLKWNSLNLPQGCRNDVTNSTL